MRCLTVIQELSTPTGDLPSALLAEHLAGCPSCARFAERNAKLDRLWEATRPPELSAVAWDRMWANVSESLDQPRVAVPPALTLAPAPAPVVSRPWHRSAVAVFALAQAAAILLCFGLAWHQSPTRLRPQSPPLQQPQPATIAAAPVETDEPTDAIPAFDISPDQTVMISLDRGDVRNLPTDEDSNALSPFSLPMFNAVESLASLQ